MHRYFRAFVIIILISIVSGQSPFMSTYIEKQLNCALDRAPCDYYGHQIKRSLPSILTNDCRNCDPRKMSNAQHMARYIEIRYPEIWSQLVQKYGNRNIVKMTNNGKK